MKTKLEELLKTVTSAIETLKADAAAQEGPGDSPFTPQLGSALGGLRTAKDGIEAHLAKGGASVPASRPESKPASN